MRNSKKQAIGAKLKLMACYLMKSDDPVIDNQRKGSQGTTGIIEAMPRVRVCVVKRCGSREGTVVQCRRRHDGATVEAGTRVVVARKSAGACTARSGVVA